MIFDRNWETDMENILKVRLLSLKLLVSGTSSSNCLSRYAGNVQCRQGPADLASYRKHPDGSLVDVITEPARDRAPEPQYEGTTGPVDDSQARKHPRAAVDSRRPRAQSVQQWK